MIPEWLIDDTAGIADAEVYVVHTRRPRFWGVLVPEDEADLEGVTLAGLPCGEVLFGIAWMDPPVFDPDELIPSLRAALELHWSIRQRGE